MLLVAGCASPDTTCGGTSDGSFPEEGYCHVTTISSPVSFDRLDFYLSRQVGSGAAPETPDILNGSPVPTTFEIDPINGLGGTVTFSSNAKPVLRDEYTDEYWVLDEQHTIGVVAYAGGELVGANGATFVLTNGSVPRTLEASITLLDTKDVELWGMPDPVLGLACLRFATGTTTHFMVHSGDQDCDGFPDGSDCKPESYCDPAATTPAAIAACTCPP